MIAFENDSKSQSLVDYPKSKRYCAQCGLRFSKRRQPTIDHTFPKSKGGTNHDFNIKLMCKPCNLDKSDNLPSPDELRSILVRAIAYMQRKRSYRDLIAITKMITSIATELLKIKRLR